ncbi:ABC transporter substrate-binding protein [Arthrobacter sp. NPDC058127]|uniref:ABC transporter substrate-binding protein n=1 Tax=Arthrobacter sp. NPDC058127 TaxID=3346351 RepID=UPI0036E7408A
MPISRILTTVAALGAAALVLTGCSGGQGSTGSKGTIVVGSANFTESKIVASLYAEALRAKGYTVTEKFNIGSREAYVPAVRDGSIDVIPDYTGNLLQYLDPSTTATSSEQINGALSEALKSKGLKMYSPAKAEDKDSVVVTSETARKWNLSSIEDLAKHNSELTFGANAEFQERAAGLPGLKAKYGLQPSKFVAIADGGGPKTVSSLLDGTVTAADIYTTTPAIVANNLVVLKDPQNNFAAGNVLPVINAGKSTDDIQKVLDAVSAQLSTEALTQLNDQVSGDAKKEPAAVSKAWLKDKGLLN